MSAYLPFEIQVEIIKRLPVKSLIQFLSVSKAWKSLIDSPDFIRHYCRQMQRLLVRYKDKVDLKEKYVSTVDDDSFPKQRVSLPHPPFVSMLKYSDIIGSDHGLLCFYGCDGLGKDMVIIWNSSIRKAVAVVVPNVADGKRNITVVGFGVCGETSDPKIVKITYIDHWYLMESITDSIPWQVEVFTLSTGAWRSPYINPPRKLIAFDEYNKVVIDGVLYWFAVGFIAMNGGFDPYNMIVSFDMTSEEFKEVNLPHSFTHNLDARYACISKLNKSLVVIECNVGEMISVVWIMEGGVPKTFTKLYTIYTPAKTVLGFRKSGGPVIEHRCELVDDSSSLVVYDPYLKHFNNLEIDGRGSYDVYSYMETLLLLDHPDFTIYNEGKRDILMHGAKNK